MELVRDRGGGVVSGRNVKDGRWEWELERECCAECMFSRCCCWTDDEESDGDAGRVVTDVSRLVFPRIRSCDGREDDAVPPSREGAMLFTLPEIVPGGVLRRGFPARELRLEEDGWLEGV